MTEDSHATDAKLSPSTPLVVIPDANILIHGRALVDLPWAELERDPIIVMLVPPVIREIDKLKVQSGRPNRIARQVSSDIRTMLKARNRSSIVKASGPAVSKRVELAPVTTALAEGIDLGHADQVLINYALHLKAIGHDVLLLTDDTICAASAEGFGVSVHLIEDHWLRDAEPDETSKEVARLRAEIARLEAAEPQVVLSFSDPFGGATDMFEATITRWAPLAAEDVERLMARVEQLCSAATSFDPDEPRATDRLAAMASISQSFLGRTTIEPPTEEEIEAYRSNEHPYWLSEVRDFLASLHEHLHAHTEWPVVRASAANTGTRPARATLLRIEANGAFAIEEVKPISDEDDDVEAARRSRLALPLPPSPPRGRVRYIDPFGLSLFRANTVENISHNLLPHSSFNYTKQRDSDVFYWRKGREGWVDTMILECASWRHAQDAMNFDLRLCPDGFEAVEGAVVMTVHAENLSAVVSKRLPVRLAVVDGATITQAEALVEALGKSAAASGRL